MSFTIKNLREVEDMAAKHGFSETQEARFPREDLDAESTGLAYLVLRPGKQQPFAHRHDEAEEIYVVLSGSGRVKLDDEIVEHRPDGRHPGGARRSRARSRPATRASSCSPSDPATRATPRSVKDFWSRLSRLRRRDRALRGRPHVAGVLAEHAVS